MTTDEIGDLLRRLDGTQGEIAEKIERETGLRFSQATISAWKSGTRRPGIAASLALRAMLQRMK